MIKIHITKRIEEEQKEQIERLLKKLNAALATIDISKVNAALSDGEFILFSAVNELNETVGMLTLTHCRTMTLKKYWIEDVIVDDSCRGKGIGRALVKAAIEYAEKDPEHPAIYLTSNPSRTAARELYRSEGFEEYPTGVFKKVL